MPLSTRGYSRAITATSIVGVLLSAYALYVEMALEAKPDYKALCDISEHMSCTKVLGSKYGKGFGLIKNATDEDSLLNVPNCAVGIVFYLLLIFLATFDHRLVVKLQLLLSGLALASSVYLAYILYFILYDFCVVCVSTYIVNIINLQLTLAKHASLRPAAAKTKSKKP